MLEKPDPNRTPGFDRIRICNAGLRFHLCIELLIISAKRLYKEMRLILCAKKFDLIGEAAKSSFLVARQLGAGAGVKADREQSQIGYICYKNTFFSFMRAQHGLSYHLI